MRWEEFNSMVWEAYPWCGEKVDYLIKCPAISVSFDNGGTCRGCGKFTTDVMEFPHKENVILSLTYKLLQPKPRICSRECLFNYINRHYAEILEQITS